MKRLVSFIICLAFTISAYAATLDRATLIIVDTSGSGRGEGVPTATDGHGLREGTLRAILAKPWLDETKSSPKVAVITCSDHPEVLLPSTGDRGAIDVFLKGLRLTSSGSTSIDSTLELLRAVGGRPDNIIYLGDGLLVRRHTPSSQVVRELPAGLVRIYGTTPRLHMIAVDSSRKVLPRTKVAWISITKNRVAEVRNSSDIDAAVAATARNLNWELAKARPNPRKPPSISRKLATWCIAVAFSLLAIVAVQKLRSNGSRLNAFITIEEDGRTRRASASAFGKSELSIGDGECDVKVPKLREPIRLVQREVIDRRGRKRRQTVAQQGNRSVILSGAAASFSNGTTTVKLRGGRR